MTIGSVSEGIHGNSYYVVVDGGTWSDAETNAIAAGGNLVAIGSTTENNYLISTFTGSGYRYKWGYTDQYWTGGIRDGTSFSWSNGENFVFSNWGTNEPALNGDNIEIFLSCLLIKASGDCTQFIFHLADRRMFKSKSPIM